MKYERNSVGRCLGAAVSFQYIGRGLLLPLRMVRFQRFGRIKALPLPRPPKDDFEKYAPKMIESAQNSIRIRRPRHTSYRFGKAYGRAFS